MRRRLAVVGGVDDLAERVARAGQELVGVGRVDGDGELQPPGVIQRRVGQAHRRHEPRQGRPVPGDIHVLGIHDAGEPDRAQPLEERGPFGGRLHVRGQRARDRRRRTGEEDHQLAADVQPGEVVDARFGDRQAIAGEDHLGLERRRRLDPRAEDRVLAQDQRLPLTGPPDERQARMGLVDLARDQPDRLEAPLGPGRLESGPLELARHVLGGLAVALGARCRGPRACRRPGPGRATTTAARP